MFLYRELACYHLTPRGWYVGDKYLRHGIWIHKPAPLDQVLSVVSKTIIARSGATLNATKEVWRSTDHARVIGLIARFGPMPPALT